MDISCFFAMPSQLLEVGAVFFVNICMTALKSHDAASTHHYQAYMKLHVRPGRQGYGKLLKLPMEVLLLLLSINLNFSQAISLLIAPGSAENQHRSSELLC